MCQQVSRKHPFPECNSDPNSMSQAQGKGRGRNFALHVHAWLGSWRLECAMALHFESTPSWGRMVVDSDRSDAQRSRSLCRFVAPFLFFRLLQRLYFDTRSRDDTMVGCITKRETEGTVGDWHRDYSVSLMPADPRVIRKFHGEARQLRPRSLGFAP